MNALMPEGSRCLLLVDIGPGKDEEVVGDVGERDPALLAGQDVAAALPDRRRLDGARVAARRRFGEAVAGDSAALRLRHEIPLLLILGAPRQQRQAVEAGVHRHDDAQRRVDVLELFADEPERDVVHPGAAVLCGHATPSSPSFAIPPSTRSRSKRCCRSFSLMYGRDFARGPLADRLLEQPLFVGESEVDHDDTCNDQRRLAELRT